MLAKYELLKFLGEFKGTRGHSKRTEPVSIHSIYLWVFVSTNIGLGCSLLKLAFDIQEIVAPVSNREMVFFLIYCYREICSIFHIA